MNADQEFQWDVEVEVSGADRPTSRRNVVAGMAFALPVIMGVGAAPAIAASRVVDTDVDLSGRTLTVTIVLSGVSSGGDTVVIGISRSNDLKYTGDLSKTVNRPGTTATFTLTITSNPKQNPKTYSVTYTVTPGGLSGVAGSFSY